MKLLIATIIDRREAVGVKSDDSDVHMILPVVHHNVSTTLFPSSVTALTPMGLTFPSRFPAGDGLPGFLTSEVEAKYLAFTLCQTQQVDRAHHWS
jgi:hypothetical protein